MESIEELKKKFLLSQREKLIENIVINEVDDVALRRKLAKIKGDSKLKQEYETRLLNAQNLVKATEPVVEIIEEMLKEYE